MVMFSKADEIYVMATQQSGVMNLNKDDVQSKAILTPDGIAPPLYAGECRYGGGEMYVMATQQPAVFLASEKDVAGCLMASGYVKLGGQEMFSGDYLVIEKHGVSETDRRTTEG